MPATRFLSFLFCLIFFCVFFESSAFSENKNACHIEQTNPKAIPAQGAKTTQKTLPQTDPKIKPEKFVISELDCSDNKKIHYVAATFTAFSALMSYNNAISYNDLSEKNISLATQYKNSNKSSEKASYKSEYDNNNSKMKKHKSRIKTWDFFTLVGLVWTVFLQMKDDSEETFLNYNNSFPASITNFVIKSEPSEPQTIFQWNWRF